MKIAKINSDVSGYNFKYGLHIATDESLRYPYLFKMFQTLEELKSKKDSLIIGHINGQSADEEWLAEDEFTFIEEENDAGRKKNK